MNIEYRLFRGVCVLDNFSNLHTCQVIFGPENLFSNIKDVNNGFISIKHPRSGIPVLFYLHHISQNKVQLMEVQKMQETHRSWILHDVVKEDATALLLTPFDPLFLVLPYLVHQEKFVTLETLLEDDENSKLMYLVRHAPGLFERLHLVTDVKEVAEYKVYRFNEMKALEWLAKKAQSVKKSLIADSVPLRPLAVAGEATAAGFGTLASLDDDERATTMTHYAWGIVSDCLPLKLSETLFTHLGLVAPVETEAVSVTVTTTVVTEVVEDAENSDPTPSKKRNGGGSVKPKEDYMQDSKPAEKVVKTTMTATARSLAKVRGAQSITNFFQKK